MVKRESSHNMLSNLRLACSIKAHGSSTGCQICCRADLFVIIQFESSERRAACIKKPRLIPLDCDASCRRGSTHHDRGSPFWHGHLPRHRCSTSIDLHRQWSFTDLIGCTYLEFVALSSLKNTSSDIIEILIICINFGQLCEIATRSISFVPIEVVCIDGQLSRCNCGCDPGEPY